MTKIIRNKSNVDLDYPVVRPSLDLDFTQEELDPRITFTRGTIGTRVNRNRLIETVPANQPRFDYDPVTGECKGLLIEESRTNLLTYSEDFSNVIWTSSATNIINTNSITSPSGSTNGNQITNNSITNNFNFITQQYSSTTKGSYTYSIFVKNNNIPVISLLVGIDGYVTNYARATYTFSSQSFGSFQYVGTLTNWVSSTSSSAYPNGWYKVSITFNTTNFTSQSTLNVGFYPGVYGSTTLSYLKSFYVWGAQLEAGAFPTSYIPTITSSVLRSDDLFNMIGTNFSSWYNQSEGTFFSEVDFLGDKSKNGFPGVYYVTDGTNINGIGLLKYDDKNDIYSTYDLFVESLINGTRTNAILSGFTPLPKRITPNIFSKTSHSYKNNEVVFYIDGNFIGQDLTMTIPTVNKLTIGNLRAYTSFTMNGHISRLTYYPRALKPSQLQLLTS